MASAADHDVWIPTMRTLFRTLPRANFLVIKELVLLMTEVAAESERNKMTTSNLAIVFAPNMIKSRNEELRTIMQDTPFINSFLRKVIENYNAVFDD
jgi:23S rRNA A2030 N6-methylase RlmJ